MIKYTKDETLQRVEDAAQDMKTFYSLGIVNWSGETPKRDKPTQLYSEIISGFFLKKDNYKKLFAQIPQLIREKSYDCPEKARKTSNQATDKRGEEKIAKVLWESQKNYNGIGKMIKHQMPLKDYNQKKDNEPRAGKVDLVSYDEKSGKVFLIEFKKPTNTETLLRCGLEAYTYFKQLDKKKFVSDFQETGKLPAGFKIENIVPAILVFNGARQHQQFNKTERPKTCELLEEKLKIECFVIDDKYKVSKMKQL